MSTEKKLQQSINNSIKFVENYIYPWNTKEKKLDYIQKKILKSFKDKHYLQLLCSRQVGTSTASKLIIAYSMICFDRCRIGVISRDRDFVEDVQEIIDSITNINPPKYVIKASSRIVLDNGSDLIICHKPSPNTTFLGNSIDTLIIEDAAYINNLEEVMTCLTPMLAVVHERDKKRKVPYGIIMSSIPNEYDKNNYFQKTWTSNKESIFTKIEVNWKRIARFRYDKNWYNDVCRYLFNDKKKIDRELNLKFV